MKCSFIKQKEFAFDGFSGTKTKFGRYHGSMWWDLEGFGDRRWIVATKIKCDWKKELADGKDKKQLIEACINTLNTPLTKRKNSKKILDNLYYYRAEFKTTEDGDSYIVALLAIDSISNKNFWGKGERIGSRAVKARQNKKKQLTGTTEDGSIES